MSYIFEYMKYLTLKKHQHKTRLSFILAAMLLMPSKV